MNNIKPLARKNVQELTPYLSARRVGGTGDIWLNANEMPEGDIFQIDYSQLNRYPEFQPIELISSYANFAAVKNSQLLATRGSDESIELIIRTFCEPGIDKILISPPTYGVYAISAQTCGVEYIEAPLNENFDTDILKIEEKLALEPNIKVIFLCSPNNPTGNILGTLELERLLKACDKKTLVVVDEAYIEFCPTFSVIPLIDKYENLIVTRTLSKAFALASIRCGFTIANEKVIEMIKKVIAPYPIPFPVSQIATQALSAKGITSMKANVEILNNNREIFKKELLNCDCVIKVFSSFGNFLLVSFRDGKEVFQTLSKSGIVTRDFSDKPNLSDCIRISLGTQEQMQKVIDILKGIKS